MTHVIRLPFVLIALLAAAAAGPAFTQEEKIRVEGLDLGPHWYGARVSDGGRLAGKVVLFVLWGT